MRFKEPNCVAPDPDDPRGVCGVQMRALGERHPSFDSNFKPGHWVFQCPRCEAVRAIEDARLAVYLERTR